MILELGTFNVFYQNERQNRFPLRLKIIRFEVFQPTHKGKIYYS